jgi:hypothetical protein
MYCPTYFHNTTAVDATLAQLKEKWHSIYNKTSEKGLPYKLTFTGGEVTINKNFLPFIQWLNEFYGSKIVECGITTNGSATKKVYLELVTFVSFSTHSEFFNEAKFFSTIVEVDSISKTLNKSIHINIMNEYWNKTNIEKYCQFLTKNNINHSVNEIDYSEQIREYNIVNKSNKYYTFDNE